MRYRTVLFYPSFNVTKYAIYFCLLLFRLFPFCTMALGILSGSTKTEGLLSSAYLVDGGVVVDWMDGPQIIFFEDFVLLL